VAAVEVRTARAAAATVATVAVMLWFGPIHYVHSAVRHCVLYIYVISVSVCETSARKIRSVWAAVSPKRLRFVFHRFGSYDPRMPIVNVSITTSRPGWALAEGSVEAIRRLY
jgi:hypothetical protein